MIWWTMIDFVKATEKDLDFLYNLRNEYQSRKYSKRGYLEKRQIKQDYLENDKKMTYIARLENKDIGYVIYELLDKDEYEISIAVSPEQRGRGIGKRLLMEANRFAVESLGAKKIVAVIYPANKSSINIFEMNSYKLFDSSKEPWEYHYYPPKTTKSVVFIFDFDGVLVDSVPVLQGAYYDFLNDYGLSGNNNEFNELNGPKLDEIISILKTKYNFSQSHEELYNHYLEKIEKAYRDIKLNEGVKDILLYITKNDYKVALASSSNKNMIMEVLKKNNIYKYFDYIIAGEDVEKAKPSPDIYNKVKERLPGYEYYVIEDSENGLNAAHNADIPAIHFNPNARHISVNSTYTINKISELMGIIDEVELNCFTVAEFAEAEIELLDFTPKIDESEQAIIEETWRKADKSIGLFNGQILYYKSHRLISEKLELDCFKWEYKLFFAQQSSLFKQQYPIIAVSGIIIDEDNNTLIARRQNVTEYNGFYELVPSGSISISKVMGNKVDYTSQIIEEFEEETGLKQTMIKEIAAFCLIYDRSHGTYDIGFKIKINVRLKEHKEMIKSKENDDFEIINLAEFSKQSAEKNFIPTSLILASNLNNK